MKTILIVLIKTYKLIISPFLPKSCRFVPTCSQYGLEAISKYGAVKGGWMTIYRISKCHPFHPGGYDPVK